MIFAGSRFELLHQRGFEGVEDVQRGHWYISLGYLSFCDPSHPDAGFPALRHRHPSDFPGGYGIASGQAGKGQAGWCVTAVPIQQFRDGDAFQALLAQALEDRVQRLRAGRALAAGQVVAVVQQDDVAAPYLASTRRATLAGSWVACRGCAATRPPGCRPPPPGGVGSSPLFMPTGGAVQPRCGEPVTAAMACFTAIVSLSAQAAQAEVLPVGMLPGMVGDQRGLRPPCAGRCPLARRGLRR